LASWRAGPERLAAGRVAAFNDETADVARSNHERIAPARFAAVPSIVHRLALAAAGEVDAGISLTPRRDPCDIAGGHALFRGVGGDLVQLDGKPVTYAPSAWFRGCIGGRPGTVAELAGRKLDAPAQKEKRHPAWPKRRTSSAFMLSRAQGALLGQLTGDALGSVVEFQKAEAIRSRHPHGVGEITDGGTCNSSVSPRLEAGRQQAPASAACSIGRSEPP
jgi:hypothetical protein